MIRTRPIQLAVPIRIWKIALPESFRIRSITAGSSLTCRRSITTRPRPRLGVLRVLLADAPRDGRRGADRHADRDRVDEREHRLRDPHGRDGVRAELRHPEDVRDREDGLHDHLRDHGDREQDDRPPDRALGVVAVRAADGFAQRLPEADRYAPSAFSKSSMTSSVASRPTDIRTSPFVMPG